jgi:hypothetical protein
MAPIFRNILGTVVCAFFCASPVYAASVTVIPSGNPASFSVEGSGMDGVSGIQLDIAYDAASMSTPTVTQGSLVSGAMLAANTSQRGLIKIAIISSHPFSGSGPIASISFASRTGTGGLSLMTTSMIDSNGSPIATLNSSSPASGNIPSSTPGIISSPGVPFNNPTPQATATSQQQSTSTVTTTGAIPTPTATPIYPGTVTLPSDTPQTPPPAPSPVPLPPVEPVVPIIEEQQQPSGKPAADEKTEETPQYVVYKGILDRFKQYSGNKNLVAMAALFNNKVVQTISQEPAILLSDGQSRANLTVDIPSRITASPNFAVNGGTLVSFRQDKRSKGRWIVEVLPEAGAVRVTVTIIAGAEESEFPLTVAPPVNTALPLDETGWNRFIKEVGTSGALLHDLNNDGLRDYVDEFIFVANYLVGNANPLLPESAPKQPAK